MDHVGLGTRTTLIVEVVGVEAQEGINDGDASQNGRGKGIIGDNSSVSSSPRFL